MQNNDIVFLESDKLRIESKNIIKIFLIKLYVNHYLLLLKTHNAI